MSKFKPLTLLILATIVAVFLLSKGYPFMSHEAFAQKLVLDRTVMLERGTVPKPNTIVRTQDNGFVIAGTSGGEAWATGTDADGKVKWRYTTPRINKNEFNTSLDPEYHSAAIMADDSVYLCGEKPLSVHEHIPALVVHLDNKGSLISEKIYYPQNDKSFEVSRLQASAASGDGVILFGNTHRSHSVEPTETHPLPYDMENYYWILSLDKNGEKKWEKLVPTILHNMGIESHVQSTLDGHYIFVIPNMDGTEVISMDSSGQIMGQRVVDRRLLSIAYPLTPDNNILLLVASSDTVTTINLSNNLQELSRATQTVANISPEFGMLYQAYRFPDHSLMLFGSLGYRSTNFAMAAQLDASLQHAQILNLSPVPDSSYWVKAAVPTSIPNQFAAVRSVIKPSQPGDPITEEKLQESRLGVALDFISLKPSH